MKTSFGAALTLLLAAGFALSACSDSLVEGGRPHTVELTADRMTAAVGDSVQFTLQGSGSLLAGISIEYGDGAADTVAAEGAVTAGMIRKHAYSAPGAYTAVGTVVDGTNLGLAQLKDSVTVQITGGGS